MKIIGIDVGGTHADGVLLDEKQLIAKKKIVVGNQLQQTVIALLEELLAGHCLEDIGQIHLSSTLCTNAVACNTLAPVAMFIQAGPGMNPDFLDCGEHSVFIDGAIDHLGHVVKEFDPALVDTAMTAFVQDGICSWGMVTKFSHRNPEVEKALGEKAAEYGIADITLGHTLSGMPNFPRRVYTTWLNAGLKRQFSSFAGEVQTGLDRLGITAPLLVLKADGGTMPLSRALELPCESVLSGPSSSVMGALALVPGEEDSIVVDIGGTTTDIALFAEGQSLMEPYGITIMGRPTLIRALNTKSVGLGGDSRVVRDKDGLFSIGPERAGIPAAFSQKECTIDYTTPSDALALLGRLEGDKERAAAAIELLSAGGSLEQTAQDIVDAFAAAIKKAVDDMVEEIFSRPVYTVSALLHRQRLQPARIIAVGGPADALQQEIGAAFALPCTVPEHYEVANAIGAARTRTTLTASLYANSKDGVLSIPELGVYEEIGRSFTFADAEERLKSAIHSLAIAAGYEQNSIPDVDIIEREELNTVQGFSATGKIITLKGQIRPGLV